MTPSINLVIHVHPLAVPGVPVNLCWWMSRELQMLETQQEVKINVTFCGVCSVDQMLSAEVLLTLWFCGKIVRCHNTQSVQSFLFCLSYPNSGHFLSFPLACRFSSPFAIFSLFRHFAISTIESRPLF